MQQRAVLPCTETNMNYSVDRIEEDIAVLESLETGELKYLPREKMHEGAAEGDIVELSGGTVRYLEGETAQRKESVSERFNKLKRRKCNKTVGDNE